MLKNRDNLTAKNAKTYIKVGFIENVKFAKR
jgi:hypothetical protein